MCQWCNFWSKFNLEFWGEVMVKSNVLPDWLWSVKLNSVRLSTVSDNSPWIDASEFVWGKLILFVETCSSGHPCWPSCSATLQTLGLDLYFYLCICLFVYLVHFLLFFVCSFSYALRLCKLLVGTRTFIFAFICLFVWCIFCICLLVLSYALRMLLV